MPRRRIRETHRAAASDRLLASVLREESARIVAALTGWLGSLDLAEESVAEAIEEAVRQWRTRGVPPNPGGWLTQAARHNALDRIRREKRYREKLALLSEPEAVAPEHGETDPDERLPLLFGCCHPALSPDAQLALTLRAICGLTTAQIARATLGAGIDDRAADRAGQAQDRGRPASRCGFRRGPSALSASTSCSPSYR